MDALVIVCALNTSEIPTAPPENPSAYHGRIYTVHQLPPRPMAYGAGSANFPGFTECWKASDWRSGVSLIQGISGACWLSV